MKFSLSNRDARGTVFSLSQVEWTVKEALTQKKAGIPFNGLNSGSCFMSQDEGMSESPVETVEKAVGCRLIWTRGITSFDTWRGTRNSMLQTVTMPDSF